MVSRPITKIFRRMVLFKEKVDLLAEKLEVQEHDKLSSRKYISDIKHLIISIIYSFTDSVTVLLE